MSSSSEYDNKANGLGYQSLADVITEKFIQRKSIFVSPFMEIFSVFF